MSDFQRELEYNGITMEKDMQFFTAIMLRYSTLV